MLNEKKLTKSELDKREDIIMKMKKNKRSLVQKYGKDAEQVMYGRATNMAKKQAESMNNDRLKEMIKDALKNPSKADLNKDGKLSDYEETRGAAIEKAIVKEWGGSDQFALIKSMHRDLGEPTEFPGLTQIMYAAEDATDFYMDDFEEYTTDKDSLILANARSYARKHFPEFMEMAANMVAPSNINRFNEVAGLNLNTTRDEEGGVEISDPDADEAGILDTEAGLGLEEGASSEEKRIAMSAVKRLAKYRGVSQDEAKADLLRAVKELGDLNEDLDLGHEDNEPGMLKAELYHIGSYAMDLYKMMDALEGQGEVDFPAWWQSKITTAKNMISGAKHYLEFELKEPTIDAMVDRMDDIAPEMEVDVVDDIEEVDGFNPKKTDDPQLDRFRAKGQLEGLPKGYWDKKMDAKDEVKETLDDSAFDMADSIYDAIGGMEFKKAIVKAMSTDDAKLYLSAIMRDYALNERIDYDEALNLRAIKSELEDEIAQLYRDMEQEAEPEGGEVADRYGNALDKLEDRLAKVQKQLRDYDMNESYNTLVNKIKKSGKSEKAAKAIAGAVASYKAKGGGKGPTAKQKG